MSIKEKIETDYIIAFKARQQELVDTYRNIKSEILKLEKTGKDVTESDIVVTLTKYANQRKDSIEQFTKVGKTEEALKEQRELDLIQTYLPKQMDTGEIKAKVIEIITTGGYTTPKDMGKIISEFKNIYTGQADGKLLSEIVKAELNK